VRAKTPLATALGETLPPALIGEQFLGDLDAFIWGEEATDLLPDVKVLGQLWVVGNTLDGKYCGGIGDVGIYSFDAVKNLAVGEGGGLTAKDPALLERARVARYCGIEKSGFEAATYNKTRWWEYNISDFDHKYLPSDVVYVTVVSPGTVKGPYLHLKRWGVFTCIKGNVKIVIKTEDGYVELYSGEGHDFCSVQIPAGTPAAIQSLGDQDAYVLNLPSPAWHVDDQDDHPVSFDDYTFTW
jgi:mannose-6-phosphate isomerase-like protein (cupin superfamily)